MRNKGKILQRLAVTSDAVAIMDVEKCELAKKRPLSSVLNVIDLTTSNDSNKAACARRTEWLQRVQKDPFRIKSEPDAPPAAPPAAP